MELLVQKENNVTVQIAEEIEDFYSPSTDINSLIDVCLKLSSLTITLFPLEILIQLITQFYDAPLVIYSVGNSFPGNCGANIVVFKNALVFQNTTSEILIKWDTNLTINKKYSELQSSNEPLSILSYFGNRLRLNKNDFNMVSGLEAGICKIVRQQMTNRNVTWHLIRSNTSAIKDLGSENVYSKYLMMDVDPQKIQ